MPRSRESRRFSPPQLFGLMAVTAAAAGALLGFLTARGEDAGLVALGTGAIGLVLAATALWTCLVYWRRLDEAAREAHKFAWYWGGSAGLVLTGVGFVLLALEPDLALRLQPADAAPADWIMLGGLAVGGLQVAGYVVTWIGWWLWKGR